jgi:hypothetical protein
MASDMASDHTSDLPLACSLSADELRARGETLAAPLFARVQRVDELPDGYCFAFAPEEDGVRDVFDFVLSERACCPFFTFELAFPSPHQVVWLTIRGREGVKEIVANSFALRHLPTMAAGTESAW